MGGVKSICSADADLVFTCFQITQTEIFSTPSGNKRYDHLTRWAPDTHRDESASGPQVQQLSRRVRDAEVVTSRRTRLTSRFQSSFFFFFITLTEAQRVGYKWKCFFFIQ